MKFIISIILCALTTYCSFMYSEYTPWWLFAVGAFLVGLALPQKSWLSWMAGFLAVFICWSILNANFDNKSSTSFIGQMAEVLKIGKSGTPLIFISAAFGGLIGGFAMLTGNLLRSKKSEV